MHIQVHIENFAFRVLNKLLLVVMGIGPQLLEPYTEKMFDHCTVHNVTISNISYMHFNVLIVLRLSAEHWYNCTENTHPWSFGVLSVGKLLVTRPPTLPGQSHLILVM